MDFSVAATNVGVLLFRAAVEMNLWVSFSKARRGIIYLASEKGAVALGLGAQGLAAVTDAPCAAIQIECGVRKYAYGTYLLVSFITAKL